MKLDKTATFAFGLLALMAGTVAFFMARPGRDSVTRGGAATQQDRGKIALPPSEGRGQGPILSARTRVTAEELTPDGGSEPQPVGRVEHARSLSRFRFNCWDDDAEGASYSGEYVSTFAVLVPTNFMADTAFDFCITSVKFGQTEVQWDAGGILKRGLNRELDVRGRWYVRSGRDIKWDTETGAPGFVNPIGAQGPLCVRGTASQSSPKNVDEKWGFAVGFELFTNPTSGAVGVYKPQFEEVVVTMSGAIVPTLTRMSFAAPTAPGEKTKEWCANVLTTSELLFPTGAR